MRANAALKNRVAVVEQVVRGDGGRRERACALHVLRCVSRGDVLKHDFQARKIAAQRDELLVNEHRLAVKQIHVAIGHLAVHQERHARALHGF